MAARVAERKVIRAGLDAWQAIGKADTFENWKKIAAALAVGKAHALRVTGANAAWGQNTRTKAIELHENIVAIEQWRETLPERQGRALIHPLSIYAAGKQRLHRLKASAPMR